MESDFALRKCHYCNHNMVTEKEDVCSDCFIEYDYDITIGDALLSLAALKKMNPDFLATHARFEDIKYISSQYRDLVDEIDAYIKFKG